MVAKKPPRNTSLVVSAIRKLRDVQGTSSKEIMNFIASEYDVSGSSLKRHVQMALRRGMSCGIIEKAKGGYVLAKPEALTISCDTLVDRSRGGRCGKKRRRRRKSCRKRRKSCRRKKKKCGRRRSRRRRRGGKCKSKRRRHRRRGMRGCGRRGRRRAGDEEMDEMAVATLARGRGRGLRRSTRLRGSKFQKARRGIRSQSLSGRSSATRSSTGSAILDSGTQL